MPMIFRCLIRRLFVFVFVCVCLAGSRVGAAELTKSQDHFDRVIAPLLARRCLECHRGAKPKGKLDLTTLKTALAGGESDEPGLVPGKLDASLIWQQIAENEMPPKKPLPADERAVIKAWIASGGSWGTDPIDPFRFTSKARAGRDWWSLVPVVRPKTPAVKNKKWAGTPIDAFVLAKLEKAGLSPSAEAERRVLIRRLSFDLIGLPPTPEQIAQFVADKSPKAYGNLVDRLLASPHYGERWARHWLDVVRFGESNGFERDLPRANSWHFRNWVIDALNRDMPYDEFVRQQLSGDVMPNKDAASTIATGFLVAGAHDTVLPNSQRQRNVMRQDELEDVVSTVGQTFLGLTIHCARCHDHKFDPISTREYYQLTATLSGLQFGDRTVKEVSNPKQLAKLKGELIAAEKVLAAMEDPLRAKVLAGRKSGKRKGPEAPKPIAAWDFSVDLKDQIGSMHVQLFGGAAISGGMVRLDGRGAYAKTAPLSKDLREKTLEAWVQLSNLTQRGGGVMTVQDSRGGVFDSIVFGEKQPRRWMAGSNGWARFKPFGGPNEMDAVKKPVHLAIAYHADGTIAAYRNGQPYGKPYRSRGIVAFKAGQNEVVFGVRHGTAGAGRMLAGAVSRARLYDRALSAEEIAATSGSPGNWVSEAELVSELSAAQRSQRTKLKQQLATTRRQVTKLTTSRSYKVYAITARQPPPVHVLNRGDVTSRGELVSPAGIAAVSGTSPDFGLASNAPEAQRRLKLAQWITDAKNPLFARVMVNRLWHYHFGIGLVDTPSDFGFNGTRPSHPALLDYLAAELVEKKFSLKQLHRLIVTSATYRQSARPNAAAAKIDADGRLLWRKPPMRLEAEAIRDTMLRVAGRLNPEIGGRGYQDTKSYFFKGTQFYDPIDPVGEQYNRRTIYRTWARGGRNPLLDTFDCPDPSATAPKRAVTITPLQALALLNNSFVLRMAEKTADRVTREGAKDTSQQIERLYHLAYGRAPEKDEQTAAAKFVADHGLAAFCRVVLNSNEFLYVD
jgi:hypothetical protein